jgi:hypothetical protein
MLNKKASSGTGQGSNDEYKHLIQVNARKFALHAKFLSKQQTFEIHSVVSGSVGSGKRPLTHVSSLRWHFSA